MKTLFLSIALFFCISQPAFAEPPTEASVRELLDKTKAGEAAVQMVSQMLPSLKMMAPGAPQEFWDGIEKEFSILARVTKLNEIIRLSGEFIVSLTDFLVERPSLLTRKIDDEINLKFDLYFK